MFTHDVIKQMYTLEGYLPNYPPHLISDEEMFEAFLPTKYFKLDTRYDEVTFDVADWRNYEDDSQPSYFKDNYPLICSNLVSEYKDLVSDISYHIKMFLSDTTYSIPSWVYSYMLGSAIGINSDKVDIHDLLVMMVCDNIDDDYDETACMRCLEISRKFIGGMKVTDRLHRPPTMFGEPHVFRYLRLRGLVS